MATIKSYTDINQSKKLAEILPLESADMRWNFYSVTTGNTTPQIIHLDTPWVGNFNWNNKPDNVPCWSLSALLNYLREIDFFPEIEADEHGVTMSICYYDEEEARPLAPVHNIVTEAETFINACYELILKLHEQNIL